LWEKHGRAEQDHANHEEHQVVTSKIEILEQTGVHNGVFVKPFSRIELKESGGEETK
jgi:hypothetical protein